MTTSIAVAVATAMHTYLHTRRSKEKEKKGKEKEDFVVAPYLAYLPACLSKTLRARYAPDLMSAARLTAARDVLGAAERDRGAAAVGEGGVRGRVCLSALMFACCLG